MAVTRTTPQAEIDRYMTQQIQRKEAAIINAFNYVGLRCINEARTNGAYKDRTGNLRNSVGYLIFVDGVIQSSAGMSQTTGGGEGETIIRKLAAQFPHGIALVVVAGMNYAASVEARNLNVLSSAELLAETMVPELMTKLGLKR